MCIACMAVKHTQGSLADPRSGLHYTTMPEKILERRLRVAVASSPDPCLPTFSTQCATTSYPKQTAQSWEDMIEEESPDRPPLKTGHRGG